MTEVPARSQAREDSAAVDVFTERQVHDATSGELNDLGEIPAGLFDSFEQVPAVTEGRRGDVDRARTSLDRHATYIVAAYVAGAAR